MTIRIVLACAAGFSTSMLMERMKEAAQKKEIDVSIDAMPESKLDKVIDQIDILLLGPQLGHLEDKLTSKYVERNIYIATIASIDYGMMNGEKVLHDVLKASERGD